MKPFKPCSPVDPALDARLRSLQARSAALREMSVESRAHFATLRHRSHFLNRRFAQLHSASSDLLTRGLFHRQKLPHFPKPKSPLRLLA